jgi:septal ring factor EnvC (AmiA/AmiB activator)
MPHQFDLLPIELQASVVELRAAHVAEDTIDTQHGATNNMLADLHSGVQEAGRGIADLKKQWSELEQWRSRIEAAIVSLTEFRSESTKDRRQLREAVADLARELRTFSGRLSAIEQLLEIAGQHEAGS